jgi:hypothetical protein
VVLVNEGMRHWGQATYLKPQRSRPTRAQGIAGKQRIVFQQAPAVLANEGSRHRRQATSFDSKPQRSQPTRALDIVGKLGLTASPSGLGQQGHKTLQARSVFQAPAVSANEGMRHHGRATFDSKPTGSQAMRASTLRAS